MNNDGFNFLRVINKLELRTLPLAKIDNLAKLSTARYNLGVKAKKDTMSASDAKNNFGELLDFARTRLMKIQKNGRHVAVLISAEEYERLETIEDDWWARQAEEAI